MGIAHFQNIQAADRLSNNMTADADALSTDNVFQKLKSKIVSTEQSEITIQCPKCPYTATPSTMENHKNLPFCTSKSVSGIFN